MIADALLSKALVQPDTETCLLFLNVPGNQVVLFQAFFELYEGLATVRTIDIRRSEVMLITTPSSLPEVLQILEAIDGTVSWNFIEPPKDFNQVELFSNYGE